MKDTQPLHEPQQTVKRRWGTRNKQKAFRVLAYVRSLPRMRALVGYTQAAVLGLIRTKR